MHLICYFYCLLVKLKPKLKLNRLKMRFGLCAIESQKSIINDANKLWLQWVHYKSIDCVASIGM